MADALVAVSSRPGRRPAALWTGGALLTALVVLGLAGRWLLPDPDLPDYAAKLLGPGQGHLLGTDQAGRDLLARVAAGTWTTFGAALLVSLVSMLVGTVVGAASALEGSRWGDAVAALASRAADVALALPHLVVALAVVGALGPGFWNLVLAMSATGWAPVARLTGAYVAGAADRPDVLAARMAGVPGWRAFRDHVLPGALTRVLVVAALGLGQVVLGMAGLSFLGLGAQPPTAEWGQMLAESRHDLLGAPWLLAGPGVALLAAVAGVSLLADGVRSRWG